MATTLARIDPGAAADVARTEPAKPRRRRSTSLQRRFGVIEGRLEQLLVDFHQERDRAERHRLSILDGINALNASVAALINDMQAVKPAVADYKERKAEVRGMGRLARWFWAIVAAAVTAGAALYGALRSH